MADSDFNELESPLRELREQIAKIEAYARAHNLPEPKELAALRKKAVENEKQIYSRLTPWDRTLIARHASRPYSLDIIRAICEEFVELHGDRESADDGAIVVGLGRFDGRRVAIIAQQKGRDVKERKLRNFGMAKPEGYRKAMRMMDLAERFQLPILSLVDTPAADPGVEAEQRGISWAIAESMRKMFGLSVPIVALVLGEGGSGGAIAIACANKVLMLQNAIYSVIPPEGCAAILWRDPARRAEASTALRLTAEDALSLELIEEIIPEPIGAAHTHPTEVIASAKESLTKALVELETLTPDQLRSQRLQRFEALGVFEKV